MAKKIDKKSLRKFIREEKSRFSIEDLRDKSADVISQIEVMPSFVKSKVVLLYNSLPDEVDTSLLIKKYKEEKKILLPSVQGNNLELHEYDKESKLIERSYGIGESDGKIFTDYDAIEYTIIPGMAFDIHMNRLGRGKGYYDRLLPMIKCEKVGICFDFQLLNDIPSEPHDIKMDTIISERTILNIE